MTPKTKRGPYSISDLESQVETFRDRLRVAEIRRAELVADTNFINRPAGMAARVRSVDDELSLSTQGLANARRVLNAALTILDYDARVEAYRNDCAVDWEDEGEDE